MNKFEFDETIKYFGYDDKKIIKNRYNVDTIGYIINNLIIYHSGSYYTIVKGRIPYDVATLLFNKYDNYKYHIRVDGGGDDWDPNSHLIDDLYINDLNKSDDVLRDYNFIKKELLKRNNNSKYIECYHIDTLDGLIAFITEYKHLDLNISEVKKEINLNIINDCFNDYREIKLNNYYYATINDEKNNNKRLLLRPLINEFDDLINPFNKEYNIIANLFDIKLDIDEKKKFKMNIDNNSYLEYSYKDNYFSYILNYMINNDSSFFYSHYFSDNSENIVISYNEKNYHNSFYYHFDLTNNLIKKEPYGEFVSITDSSISFLINEISNALLIIRNIFYQNREKILFKK